MVVVGVDGAGRTHRLTELATAAGGQAMRVGQGDQTAELRAGLAAAREDGSLGLVDDPHRLGDDVLALLAGAGAIAAPFVITTPGFGQTAPIKIGGLAPLSAPEVDARVESLRAARKEIGDTQAR